MMFKTFLGPSEDSSAQVYLRPETAQAMFVDFKTVQETSRKKIPFGIAQIGKAFRNEITPGNFIFRTREFEQMEIEYFIKPPQKDSDWEKHFDEWLGEIKKWVRAAGIDEKRVHYHDIPKGELAHYSKRTVDVEFEFPFGQKELYGLAYRTDFDLKAHGLSYKDPETGENFTPHVIEPSLGVERTALAVLLSAYTEVETRSGDEDAVHEKEIVLKLPKVLAPIKVAVLPLSKKEELTKPAYEIYRNLQKHFMCQYDETASIGKRYRRQDEIGTPFCVTYDFDSPKDGKVTVRDRDTMEQERIEVSKLADYLKERGV
jgi:glycyl-tRNA synthetase